MKRLLILGVVASALVFVLPSAAAMPVVAVPAGHRPPPLMVYQRPRRR